MTQRHKELISIEQAGTLDGLFYERLQRSADKLAYIQYNKNTKSWDETHWQDMADLISRWQQAIAKENLEAGDRVAILLKNSKEWVAVDQAALSLGLVTVPLYMEDRPDNIAYIIKDSQTKLIAIQDISQWNRLKRSFNDDSPLQRIVLVDTPQSKLKDEPDSVVTADQWLARDAQPIVKRQGDPKALATIVYTSGTTGRPKGVMLTHHNILSVAHPSGLGLKVAAEDLFLSFLPMSHTFERSLGYYLTMMVGCKVAFARSVQVLADDLLTIKPTLLISVPRIYERVYAKIENTLMNGSALKRGLFRLTVDVGWSRFEYLQSRKKFCISCLLWPLLKRLVADKVMQKFGGRLRMAASGGAAIPFPVARTFIGLGLELIQGYGLTETSPVASFNRLGNNDPRSIGHPLDTVEMKIGKNDELLIKGPGVMMGYWNNPEATSQVIDNDGWFHSGDQARISAETGHVYITGRLKDVLVMSNGEKIPPTDIEHTIVMEPLYDNIMLLGEGQPFLSAILVLNPEAWQKLAKEQSLDPNDANNIQNKTIVNYVIKDLKNVLHDFPGYAKIRKVVLSLEPWTVDNGILTPTLKVKRPKVMEKFAQEIETIYQ
jgi:long-chain acyl-CoA synthetase